MRNVQASASHDVQMELILLVVLVVAVFVTGRMPHEHRNGQVASCCLLLHAAVDGQHL